MELLFLWIENDGMTIKNQSFNFSNHVRLTFSRSTDLAGLLVLTESPNFISNFFGESLVYMQGEQINRFDGGIANVTGVIGENGVGKTNFLSYLIDLFTDNLPIGERFIVAFKDEKSKLIKIFHTLENFKLTVEGSITDFKIEEPIEQNVSFLGLNYIKSPSKLVENFELIFYSPIFDLRNYPISVSNEYKGYVDVSTNALIENDVLFTGDTYPKNIREIELHKSSNIRRQLEMVINSGLANIEGINLPDEVCIQFHRNYFDPNEGKRNLTFENEDIFKDLDKRVTEAWQRVNSTLSSMDRRHDREEKNKPNYSEYSENPEYRKALSDKLKVEFSYSFIHNYFLNLSEHYNEEIGIKLEDIKGDSLFERIEYFFD